jgi:hypothetical protein
MSLKIGEKNPEEISFFLKNRTGSSDLRWTGDFGEYRSFFDDPEGGIQGVREMEAYSGWGDYPDSSSTTVQDASFSQ